MVIRPKPVDERELRRQKRRKFDKFLVTNDRDHPNEWVAIKRHREYGITIVGGPNKLKDFIQLVMLTLAPTRPNEAMSRPGIHYYRLEVITTDQEFAEGLKTLSDYTMFNRVEPVTAHGGIMR